MFWSSFISAAASCVALQLEGLNPFLELSVLWSLLHQLHSPCLNEVKIHERKADCLISFKKRLSKLHTRETADVMARVGSWLTAGWNSNQRTGNICNQLVWRIHMSSLSCCWRQSLTVYEVWSGKTFWNFDPILQFTSEGTNSSPRYTHNPWRNMG